MRNTAGLMIAATLLGGAAGARADIDLLKKSNCMACHAVDRRVFGPSLKEVAARYAGDAAAQEVLSKRIRMGGSGVWGEAPMPPQPQVSEADAKLMAAYILGLK